MLEAGTGHIDYIVFLEALFSFIFKGLLPGVLDSLSADLRSVVRRLCLSIVVEPKSHDEGKACDWIVVTHAIRETVQLLLFTPL
jgi:hypothetical protein